MKAGLTRAAGGLLCAVLMCAVGCGTDEQDGKIDKVLKTIDEATAKLAQVRKHAQEAVTASEKSGQPITGTDKELAKALVPAEELRAVGENLQRAKERIDLLRDKTSTALRKELADRYRGRLTDNLLNLDKEERALDVALAEATARADRSGKEFVAKVRKALKDGVETFEVLTKVR